MYYILAGAVAFICIALEGYCAVWLYDYIIDRSKRRDDERRAATRPRIYKQVHEEWTILRNRRDVWDYLKK